MVREERPWRRSPVKNGKKRCARCGRRVALELFPICSHGTPDAWCRPCRAEDVRQRRASAPEHMRQIRRESSRRKIREVVERVRALKASPCTDCGRSFPHYVMHFDHRDPAIKTKAIATLCRNTVAWARVEAEIAKCDLVCANCHAIRTWKQKEARRALRAT